VRVRVRVRPQVEVDACKLRLGDLDVCRGALEVDQQFHGEHAAAW
jgi:hypothetical protein